MRALQSSDAVSTRPLRSGASCILKTQILKPVFRLTGLKPVAFQPMGELDSTCTRPTVSLVPAVAVQHDCDDVVGVAPQRVAVPDRVTAGACVCVSASGDSFSFSLSVATVG
jgi:hypothetical protein